MKFTVELKKMGGSLYCILPVAIRRIFRLENNDFAELEFIQKKRVKKDERE